MNGYNVLKYVATGIAAPDMTFYNRLRAEKTTAGLPVTTITGVPPLSILADGRPLISWSMLGNGQQTGTPSPDNIIMPTFCGVRTGNLWDNRGFSARAINDTHTHTSSNSYGTTLSATTGNTVQIIQSDNTDGGTNYRNGYFMFDIDLSTLTDGSTYVFSFDFNVTNRQSNSVQTVAYIGRSSDAVTVYQTSSEWGKSGTAYISFTASSAIVDPYIEIRLCGNSINVSNVQMAKGNTLQTYEPYGYKLSITSAGQTQTVYLGQVQTVRRVRKLVLTGQETSWYASDGVMFNDTIQPDYLRSTAITIICSHYKAIGGVVGGSEVSNGQCALYRFASVQRLYIRDNNYTSVDDFKAYLAAQHANGTPVTVWYVLAEPETGTINEPLAKIGTYADELHSEDAGVTIPTVQGSNTLTVDTTVQPSSVSITGHIKSV